MRGLIIAVVLAVATPSARAEPWFKGPHGQQRVLHLSIAAAGGLAFTLSEGVFKSSLALEACRWCVPPWIDFKVAKVLGWRDIDSADLFSTLTGYVAVPMLGLGGIALTSLAESQPNWADFLDDTLPILETVAISQVLNQAVKFVVARQRPRAYFGTESGPAPNHDDNLSFFSGHTNLAFSVVTSAGMVAHWRGYKLEPVIWGAGLPLAVATGYLRIAADKHYLTDVAVGAVVGAGAGLTIPRMMHWSHDVAITPTGNGVAVAGMF